MRTKPLSGLLAILALFGVFTALHAAPVIIFDSDFDQETAAMEAWKESGVVNITRHTGVYKIGIASVQLKSTNQIMTYVDTSPYTNMTLSFKMAGKSIPAGAAVEAYYDNGKGWVKCAFLPLGDDDGKFRSYSVQIKNGYKPLKIRFNLSTLSTSAIGYVDSVLVTGTRK